jgi:phage baseplate assembly protein W
MTVSIGGITSVDWSMKLGAIGEIVEGLDDVAQCVRIILTTPRGSDPLRPTFGADLWQYIDYPIDAAIPAIVREISEAITLWEPRIILITMNAAPDPTTIGRLMVTIVWRLRLGSAPAPPQTTVVTVPPTSAQ